MTDRHDSFPSLDRPARAVAQVALKPRSTVYALLFALTLLSWLFLAAIAVRTATALPAGGAGPGTRLLEDLPSFDLPALVEEFLRLCVTSAPVVASGFAASFALVLMWFAMACAMMLPSAAPMIRTYCEIADTASAKGEAIVHPVVLVAGYLSVWLAASVGFAALQAALGLFSGEGSQSPLTGIAGAAALCLAGLYQFTPLKQACLEKCRNPFAILFARWSTRPAAILLLGIEQGAFCLGCCWALMLVMFAVGTMNVFWMALIAIFTIVEKQAVSRFPRLAAGAILLVWASALIIMTT